MFDLDRWQEIFHTILSNKTRSILTCFGVFWGILMLVLLVGSGNGLKNAIYHNVDGFALNSSFFYASATSEPYKGFAKNRSWSMHLKDIDILRKEVHSIEYIAPMIMWWSNGNTKNVVYKQKSASHSIKGLVPEYFNIESQKIHYGRLINKLDIQQNRKVCLIGKKVYETLFDKNTNPIGEYIRVNGIYFQIVGVVSEKAQVNIGGRSSESISLPMSTMQLAFGKGDQVEFLSVTTRKGESGAEMREQIKSILKRNNDIAPNDQQAVGSFDIESQAKSFDNLFLGIAVLIWIVGLGTLFSGIVGVSNILLITVKERTREIGVRRALGANPMNIITQIMSESLVLTAFAGMIGMSLGVLILDIVNRVIGDPEEFTLILSPGISIGTAISATVILLLSGMVAGIIPAWRALQVKAIDAIRDE